MSSRKSEKDLKKEEYVSKIRFEATRGSKKFQQFADKFIQP